MGDRGKDAAKARKQQGHGGHNAGGGGGNGATATKAAAKPVVRDFSRLSDREAKSAASGVISGNPGANVTLTLRTRDVADRVYAAHSAAHARTGGQLICKF